LPARRRRRWKPKAVDQLAKNTKCLLDTFDDAHVALGAVAQRGERLLIGRTVMCRHGLLDAVELNQNGALHEPVFVDFGRFAARKKTGAVSNESGASQLGIGCKFFWIFDSAVRADPIGFWYGVLGIYFNSNLRLCGRSGYAASDSTTGFLVLAVAAG
jgi:hypothetical protein